MNKKYFEDSLSDEALAKIIDDTLNFKKTSKNRSIKNNLLKIIPAVATVVLVIGLMNILPLVNITNIDGNGNAGNHGAAVTSEDIIIDPIDDASNKTILTYDELVDKIYDKAILVEKTFKDISDISVNLTNHDIYILRGDGNSVKVKYYEWTEDEYELFDDNGNLTLKYMDSDKYCYIDENGNEIYEWVNSILQNSGRNINPDNPDTDICAIAITIPKNVTLESLNITGMNGDITITGCNIKKIDTYSVNGDIAINSYDCKDGQSYNLGTKNGDIFVNYCSGLQNLSAGTINGGIFIDYCQNVQNLIADTATGGIFLSDCNIRQATINGEVFNNIKNDTFSRNDINNSTTFNYGFYDGTRVTAFDSYTIKNTTLGDSDGYIIFTTTSCIITFTNGIIVDAPINTKVEIRDGMFTATIGDSEATVTHPDGTSSTVSSGTVLDSDGNVIN
ncbi:MAG: DUF4097 domain-containing protein [Oscillospiraceae bacterium]|nr:DUF4097 domain-containing protein [Oscillospiraceae bacterium]